jgi:chromosome segregation ATPase
MAKTLRDHEELCQERMKNIEAKFDTIETKIDEIRGEIDNFKAFLIKFAFKSFMSLFFAICAAVFIIRF